MQSLSRFLGGLLLVIMALVGTPVGFAVAPKVHLRLLLLASGPVTAVKWVTINAIGPLAPSFTLAAACLLIPIAVGAYAQWRSSPGPLGGRGARELGAGRFALLLIAAWPIGVAGKTLWLWLEIRHYADLGLGLTLDIAGVNPLAGGLVAVCLAAIAVVVVEARRAPLTPAGSPPPPSSRRAPAEGP